MKKVMYVAVTTFVGYALYNIGYGDGETGTVNAITDKCRSHDCSLDVNWGGTETSLYVNGEQVYCYYSGAGVNDC